MFRIKQLDHLVLRVKNLDAMIAFYTQVLGCDWERVEESLGLYQLRAGSPLIDLIPEDSPLGKQSAGNANGSGKSLAHFCLSIDPFDADHLATYLHTKGIEAGDVDTRYGAEGFGPSLYLKDPEGNTVELKGPPQSTIYYI